MIPMEKMDNERWMVDDGVMDDDGGKGEESMYVVEKFGVSENHGFELVVNVEVWPEINSIIKIQNKR